MAVLGLVAALGLWAFVQLIFIELDGRRAHLLERNDALALQLNRIDVKVEQLAALREGVEIRIEEPTWKANTSASSAATASP